MNTKRLVTVAVLIALYTVLSLFSANLAGWTACWWVRWAAC